MNFNYSRTQTNVYQKSQHYKITVSDGKGKHASTTERRRLVWENIMWPLIKDLEKPYFTLEEYQIKRDEVCREKNFIPKEITGGFISLVSKGIIIHEEKLYSIHYKLIPYIRRKSNLDYGTVMRETHSQLR